LKKYAEKPENAYKILKHLSRSTFDPELLKTSGIGKRLTAISVDTEHYNGDSSLLKKVTEIKDHLKARWNTEYIEHKKKIKR